jgi:hypothetical protein
MHNESVRFVYLIIEAFQRFWRVWFGSQQQLFEIG